MDKKKKEVSNNVNDCWACGAILDQWDRTHCCKDCGENGWLTTFQ